MKKSTGFRDFVISSLYGCNKVPRGADEVILQRFLGNHEKLLRKSALYTIHEHSFAKGYRRGDEVDIDTLEAKAEKMKKEETLGITKGDTVEAKYQGDGPFRGEVYRVNKDI